MNYQFYQLSVQLTSASSLHRIEERVDELLLRGAFPQELGDLPHVKIRRFAFADPRAGQGEPSPPIARLGHHPRGLAQRGRSEETPGLLEEGRVHEPEAAPSRAYLLLHPHDVAEEEAGVP